MSIQAFSCQLSDEQESGAERRFPIFGPLFGPDDIIEDKQSLICRGDGSGQLTDRDSDLRTALNDLLAAHRELENDRRLTAALYEKEAVRWLSKVVNGIAPELSQALMHSTIEEATKRAFSDDSFGPIHIQANPDMSAALRRLQLEQSVIRKIHIQEDLELPELTLRISWDGGGLAFNATEAIEKIALLLAQQIAETELTENPNEINPSK